MCDVKERQQQKPIWAGATRGVNSYRYCHCAKIVANGKMNDGAPFKCIVFVFLFKGCAPEYT